MNDLGLGRIRVIHLEQRNTGNKRKTVRNEQTVTKLHRMLSAELGSAYTTTIVYRDVSHDILEVIRNETDIIKGVKPYKRTPSTC
jgi:hypothetical protein